jgi:hypothetical protein
MNKHYHILFLLLIGGCTTDTKTVIQDSQDRVNETNVLNQPFDNFKIDTNEIAALSSIDLSRQEKENLANKLRPEYDYLYEYEWAQPNKPFFDHFLFLELNNDGKPDMIFQGESSGEPQCVKIHLSNENGFDGSIVFMQYLKKLVVENGQIKSITLLDPGCCSEYVEQELTYFFDENLNYKLVRHRARIGELERQYNILESPIHFEVINDKYKLRGKPVINDTGTFIHDHPNLGNTIAVFEKGATGKAWAVDKSDPEREWWYVEMNPTSDTLEFDIFTYQSASKLKRLGWMSSRYLKQIK